MSEGNDGNTERDRDDDNRKEHRINRRRWLKVAGAGLVGGVLPVGTGTASTSLPLTIIFDGQEADQETSYEFSVSGSVEPASDVGAVEASDTIDGSHVVGTIKEDTDAYRFDGELTGVRADGSVSVSIEYETTQTTSGDRLEIVSAPDSRVEYTFSSPDRIEKVLDNGDNSAEPNNDSVAQNSDGTWTVTGLTGNGYGDTFTIHGDLSTFEPTTGDFTLLLNGEEVSVTELTGQETSSDDGTTPTHRLEIVTAEDSAVDYTFTATGEVSKVFDNGDNSAETNNDTVTRNGDGTWTVTGLTGNGYGDTYEFTGDVQSFDPMEGNFGLYLDGTQVTAYELTGEEKPADSGSDTVDGGPMGGGDGYGNTVSRDQADTVVGTRSELATALSSASTGDVVYVAGDASIDAGSSTLSVPAGVTLASNRGIDGAPGGLLYTNDDTELLNADGDARVTGIRVQGPYSEYFEPDYYASGDGIETQGPNVEIDNCEIWGFATAGVSAKNDGVHVHHNHIHNNPRDGLGYGVSCGGGDQVIEWNRFNYNRHSVASNGEGGYTVRYNHFGSETIDHVIDVHRPGGTTTTIHHNTIEATTQVQNSSTPEGVAIRGTPDDVADIHHNWFYNPTEPQSTPEGWDGSAITQVHTDSWQNVEFSNNHYGSSDPGADIGHPR
jgi:hypothetical protein